MESLPYDKALAGIYALDKFGSQPGLDRIRAILHALSDPQKKMKCILVSGSNGKGSTVEMIASVLFEQGWRVGSYFSPQVEEFPERIRINGKHAAKDEIASAYSEVKLACVSYGIKATFFEVVTAMAFLIFRESKCDYAVLEVGLGGRHDATNAAEPEISCLSSLSLEHTDVLGKTIAAIAHEKCGIARRTRKLVCGMVSSEAVDAVRRECDFIGAFPSFVEDDVAVTLLQERNGKYSFRAKHAGLPYEISLSAPGRFQVSNACVALAACASLGCNKDAIERGLSRAALKYRMQKLSSSPEVYADCCHNPEAAFALAAEANRMKAAKKVLLFTAMSEKDYETMLRILRAHFDFVVLTEVRLARAAKRKDLEKAAKAAEVEFSFVPDPAAALVEAKKIAGKDGTVFIAGSIYLLGQLFGKDKILIGQ